MHLILSYFENMNVNVEVLKMVVVEFANRPCSSRPGSSSGSTLFALKTLNSQYDTDWIKYFLNFGHVNF